MVHQHSPTPDLERYIDGMLDEAQRTRFEQQLASDPSLAAELRRQSDLDESLRQQFSVPAPPPLPVQPGSPVTVTAGAVGNALLRRLGIAAILMLGAYGMWSTYTYIRGPQPLVELVRVTPEEYYRRKVADGFKPAWVCNNDFEFANTFNYRFRQPVLMHTPQGVASPGMDYAIVFSRKTLVVLAKFPDAPIAVFVDHQTACGPKSPHVASGLHLHRRDLGHLVFYEISPFDKPRMLDLFYVPERMPAPPPTKAAG